MNYCSHCGSKELELMVPAGDNRLRHVCQNCHTIHYSNPKMVVGCLPFYEDKILLCRRAIEPRKGYWNLPAGYLENGETAEEGARRESLEEAGIEIDILGVHCIYSIPRIDQIYCIFLAEMKKAEWRIGEESLEAALFEAEQIPYQDIAFPSSVFAIRKYLEDVQLGKRETHIGGWES